MPCNSESDCLEKNKNYYTAIKIRLMGINGANGEKGPLGEKGATGANGPPGLAGIDGISPPVIYIE